MAGDSTCESGNFDILPDKDVCLAYESNLDRAVNIATKSTRDGAVGGSCSIMQEVVTMPDNDTVIEMMNLFRDCYRNDGTFNLMGINYSLYINVSTKAMSCCQ